MESCKISLVQGETLLHTINNSTIGHRLSLNRLTFFLKWLVRNQARWHTNNIAVLTACTTLAALYILDNI